MTSISDNSFVFRSLQKTHHSTVRLVIIVTFHNRLSHRPSSAINMPTKQQWSAEDGLGGGKAAGEGKNTSEQQEEDGEQQKGVLSTAHNTAVDDSTRNESSPSCSFVTAATSFVVRNNENQQVNAVPAGTTSASYPSTFHGDYASSSAIPVLPPQPPTAQPNFLNISNNNHTYVPIGNAANTTICQQPPPPSSSWVTAGNTHNYFLLQTNNGMVTPTVNNYNIVRTVAPSSVVTTNNGMSNISTSNIVLSGPAPVVGTRIAVAAPVGQGYSTVAAPIGTRIGTIVAPAGTRIATVAAAPGVFGREGSFSTVAAPAAVTRIATVAAAPGVGEHGFSPVASPVGTTTSVAAPGVGGKGFSTSTSAAPVAASVGTPATVATFAAPVGQSFSTVAAPVGTRIATVAAPVVGGGHGLSTVAAPILGTRIGTIAAPVGTRIATITSAPTVAASTSGQCIPIAGTSIATVATPMIGQQQGCFSTNAAPFVGGASIATVAAPVNTNIPTPPGTSASSSSASLNLSSTNPINTGVQNGCQNAAVAEQNSNEAQQKQILEKESKIDEDKASATQQQDSILDKQEEDEQKEEGLSKKSGNTDQLLQEYFELDKLVTRQELINEKLENEIKSISNLKTSTNTSYQTGPLHQINNNLAPLNQEGSQPFAHKVTVQSADNSTATLPSIRFFNNGSEVYESGALIGRGEMSRNKTECVKASKGIQKSRKKLPTKKGVAKKHHSTSAKRKKPKKSIEKVSKSNRRINGSSPKSSKSSFPKGTKTSRLPYTDLMKQFFSDQSDNTNQS